MPRAALSWQRIPDSAVVSRPPTGIQLCQCAYLSVRLSGWFIVYTIIPSLRALRDDAHLTSVLVCLSACLTRSRTPYIGPKSRTERPEKTKFGTEMDNVTDDSDTTFKIKRSKVNLQGAVVYCRGFAHSLLLSRRKLHTSHVLSSITCYKTSEIYIHRTIHSQCPVAHLYSTFHAVFYLRLASKCKLTVSTITDLSV